MRHTDLLVFSPTRLAYAVRPHAPMPIVLAAVALASMFAATPFLIPAVADRYGVTEGTAGFISVVQVGAFATFSFFLPRFVAPSARILRIAAVTFLVANALSAFMAVFPALLALRFVAGASAGVITWIVWAEAMQDRRSLVSISAIGPMTAFVGSPILAATSTLGDQWTYGLLAVIALPATLIAISVAPTSGGERRVSRSRSNRVLLFALALVSMAGSSLFVYAAVAAQDQLGMTSTQASFGFSLNAVAGLLGSRFAMRHKRPGWWLASTGPAAIATVLGGSALWFFVGMAWWGFGFWMGVPGVLTMLSDRSLSPSERAGDAQAFMALGRTFGPAVGGFFADAGGYVVLAIAAGIGLVASGSTVIGVQEGRDRLAPTQL